MAQQQSLHHFYMSDDKYYMFKELASLKGYGKTGGLVRQVLEDYINRHQNELIGYNKQKEGKIVPSAVISR